MKTTTAATLARRFKATRATVYNGRMRIVLTPTSTLDVPAPEMADGVYEATWHDEVKPGKGAGVDTRYMPIEDIGPAGASIDGGRTVFPWHETNPREADEILPQMLDVVPVPVPLRSLLDVARWALNSDETYRPQLGCVSFSGGHIVATDGHRLRGRTWGSPSLDGEHGFFRVEAFVGLGSVAQVATLYPGKRLVLALKNDMAIRVKAGSGDVDALNRLIVEPKHAFPDWRKVVGNPNKAHAVVSVAPLAAWARTLPVVRGGVQDMIEVACYPDRADASFKYMRHNKEFKAERVVRCALAKDVKPFSFGVQRAYLADLDLDATTMHAVDGFAPLYVRVGGNGFDVVMPMRL